MKLIRPHQAHYASCLEAIQEYADRKVKGYSFLDPSQYDVANRVAHFETGRGLPPGYVKATFLWLVDEGRFLGETAIRHSLTPALLRYGGHIGYGIRQAEWGKGLGTAMLSMALGYAKENLGLGRVLITCDDDNIASARVIEKNGGILQDKIQNAVSGEPIITRRFWVNTP